MAREQQWNYSDRGNMKFLRANSVPVKLPPPQILNGLAPCCKGGLSHAMTTVWSSRLRHPSNLVGGCQLCYEIYYLQ